MNDRDRLKRMRTLRDRLERLPASDERDRMLRDVASRTVDIESGTPESPRAAEPAPVPPRVPQAAEAAPAPPRAPRPAPAPALRRRAHAAPVRTGVRTLAGEVAAATSRETPGLPEGRLLSLDDDGPAPSDRPWTRGLRG